MTDDPRRRHLTPEEAAAARRRARARRGYPDDARGAGSGQSRVAGSGAARGAATDSSRGAATDSSRGAAAVDGIAGATTPWRERVGSARLDPRDDPARDSRAAAPAGDDAPRPRRRRIEETPVLREPGRRSREDRPGGRAGERAGDRATAQPDDRPARTTAFARADRRPAIDPEPRPDRRDHRTTRVTRTRRERGTRTRRRIRVLPILALLLVVLLTLGVVTAMWADGKLTRVEALPDYPGRPAANSGTLSLIVGTDSREGLTPEQQRQLATGSEEDAGGKRTDTMMLVYSPTDGGDPMLVSLPRDLLVDVPDYGESKLNAAYTFGGPSLLVRTLEQKAHVRIDHYAEIGFGGLAGIVDALDGVDVCVPEPMDDPDAGINLPAGCQTLQGPQALGFARSRHVFATQDLQRVQNQRALLGAIMKKASSPSTALNPFTAKPLFDAVSSAVAIDSGDHVWDLAGLMWDLKGSPATVTLPYDGEESGDVGDYLVWGPSTEAFFSSVAKGRTPPKELTEGR